MAQPHQDNPSSGGGNRPDQPEPQSHQDRAWTAFRKVFGENFPPGFVVIIILFLIYIILQTKQQQQADYVPIAQFIPIPEQVPPPPPHTVVQHVESLTISTVTVTTTATVTPAKAHPTASTKGSSWLQLPGKQGNDNRKMSSSEQTFIAVKPDGVQRGLIGPIISRFEQRGFKLAAIKLVTPSRQHLEAHYADLKEKPFFPGLIEFMGSGPICAMVWEGRDVVKTSRIILGTTNPLASAPGTIRGDYAIDVGRNVCHGSDSVETAKKEIALWFKEGEIVSYKSSQFDWVYEKP